MADKAKRYCTPTAYASLNQYSTLTAHSKELTSAPGNPRGIPTAPFVDNVADYVSTREDVEPTLRSFQEMISKYQFMEVNTQRRGQGLREKIPDIQKTLETVRFLGKRRKVRSVIRTYGSPEG